MRLYKLTRHFIRRSLRTPEFAMGIQVAMMVVRGQAMVGYILGDIVFMSLEVEEPDAKVQELFERRWQWGPMESDDPFAELDEPPEPTMHLGFYQWWRDLPDLDGMESINGETEIRSLLPNYEAWPTRRDVPYGHLPFRTTTLAQDVFYRFEPWPVSMRVMQNRRKVRDDTYAAPAREVPFVASGFGAVGRYALPKLLPHCYRWELQPMAGTEIDVGACIPQNGQAGGGVEVRFRNDSHMRGPIANPVLLPIY